MKKKFFISLLAILVLPGCSFSKSMPLTGEADKSSIEANFPTKIDMVEKEDIDSEPSEHSSQNDEFEIPEYNGEPYVYINDNIPFFSEEELVTESYEYYSPLDELGRVGYAMCCCGTDLFPESERGDISMVYPTGWEQSQYDFMVNDSINYEGWLYNRCHLIAYCLTGLDGNDEANIPLLERNLFTGTRYLNVEGMWAIEETVYYYLLDNPENHVMYRVTPIFESEDLLISGVLMEAYSVEDQGAGCQFCVFVYNVQPGVSINYSTGENYKE